MALFTRRGDDRSTRGAPGAIRPIRWITGTLTGAGVALVLILLVGGPLATGLVIGSHRAKLVERTVTKTRVMQVPVENKVPVGGKNIGTLVRSFVEAGGVPTVFTSTGPENDLRVATRHLVHRAQQQGVRVLHFSVKPRVHGFNGGPITPESRYLGIVIVCKPGASP